MEFTKNKLPNFDGAIVLMFPRSVTCSQITNLFGEEPDIEIYDDMVAMTYVETKNFCCWEVNELLTNLFSLCDFQLLLFAQSELSAKILVDISFHHYDDTYPALIFDGVNMEYIRMMKADISIDPY